MKKTYKSLSLLTLVLSGLTFGAAAQTTIFNTPGTYTYTVPAGVTSVNVDAQGASGGQAGPISATGIGGPTTPGKGGQTVAKLAVTPGMVLNVYVGGAGATGSGAGATAGPIFGFNGGGNAAIWPIPGSPCSGGGGGGASDVRMGGVTLADRKIVAAGGGGAGWDGTPCTGDQPGGDGGGVSGVDATTCDAVILSPPLSYTYIVHSGGGTSTAGGAGAVLGGGSYSDGTAGVLGIGGDNVPCCTGTATNGGGIGGGGGGGYFGGGGGCWMGGGGGSSYADGAVTTGATLTTGARTGDGIVTICAPVRGAITGITSICETATTTLSNPTGVPGGTWSSSDMSVATVTPTSGIVLGILGGTAMITYTATNACGSVYTTTVVTVRAAPVAISGPTNVCIGATITLINPSLGGTWTSSNVLLATVNPTTGVVTGVAGGTPDITYSNGCGADVTTPITVDTLPSPINGLPSACIGYTTILSDPTPGGTWSSNPTSIATIMAAGATGIVTGVSAGTAVISYTLSTSCRRTLNVTIINPLISITGSDTLCIGVTTTLSLPVGSSGGAWSSGNTAIATVGSITGITGGVTGVSIGITRVTYTIGTGCILSKSVNVYPLAPVVGYDSVCVGSVTYLTDIVGGGSWTSATAAVATIAPGTGAVTGVAPGSAIITYSLSSGCYAKDTVYVIANPAPITGVAQACAGATTVLADPSPGGKWTSLNPGVATIGLTSGVVTGVFADTTTVVYTIRPNCTTNTVVTIHPLPATITGRDTLCPGKVDTLRNATPGGLWSSLTPSLATIIDTTGIDTTLASGVATLQYTMPTGCSKTKNVYIMPAPSATITFEWSTGTFYVTPLTYPAYQWYDSIQGLIPGATSTNLAALFATDYYVIVTDTKGCKGRSNMIHFNPKVLETETVLSSGISVYPNPVSGIIHIESPISLRAVVSSVDGKMLMEKPDAKTLDITQLASGMYLLDLFDNNGQKIAVRKFIKE